MKNGTIPRLSVLSFLLLFNLSAAPVYGQEQKQNYQPHNANQFPVAQVAVTKESSSSWYRFSMYNELPQWKADLLEERLLLRYSAIQNIEIDPVDNIVTVEVVDTDNTDVIKSILYHFKYNGYEEE